MKLSRFMIVLFLALLGCSSNGDGEDKDKDSGPAAEVGCYDAGPEVVPDVTGDSGCTGTESYCNCLPSNYNSVAYCTCKENPVHKSDIYCECCNFAYDDTNPDYESIWKMYRNACENNNMTPETGCK